MVTLYSFLVSMFLVSTVAPAAATTSNSFISKVCNDSSRVEPQINSTFCTTSLQSAPDSRNADLHKLGMISIRLVKLNATNTRSKIKELLMGKKLHPYVKQCLNDCYELYSDAIPIIGDIATDYKARNFLHANVKMSAVLDASMSCEEGFSEKTGFKSPLTKPNQDLFQLSAITVYLTAIQ